MFLCYAIDSDGSCCVHFINGVDGKYQDNTWGWLYKTSEYYIIKEVTPTECETIWTMLSDTKKVLVRLNCNWFQRFIYQINPENLI